jgi:hypothetical protein
LNSLLSPLAEHDDTGETWLPAGSEAAGVEGAQPIFHKPKRAQRKSKKLLQ